MDFTADRPEMLQQIVEWLRDGGPGRASDSRAELAKEQAEH